MAYAPPLGITASTLGSPPLRALVDVMVKADLRVLSFWPPATYQRARADGWSDRDMRALFDDNGIVVHDADALVAWVGPDDPGSPYFEETTPDQVFAAAEAMGARFVNALLTGRRANVTVDGAAEVLAGVKAQLPGTVKFIFQPAEEGPTLGETGGAKLMIAEGALADPAPAEEPSASAAPSRPAEETAHERRERLREARRELVAARSRQTGEPHKVIHARINRASGARSVAGATGRQLEKGNRLLQREIDRRR